jgi:undecaprenyl-diphosphatase
VTPAQAVLLGTVQGLTEFLPVSSSGHLILVPVLLGWPDQGLAFDAIVHLATAMTLACYFARDLVALGRALLERGPAETRLLAAIVMGSIPAGVAGLALGNLVEARLRSAVIVAVSLIVWGLVLRAADRQAPRATRTRLAEVGPSVGFVVGCFQAVALIPGTSRSGIAISAGLLAGLDRPTAARFAFLLGLPITAAAGLLKAVALTHLPAGAADPVALATGFLAAFFGGLFAVWFLVRYLERRTLEVFVVYRIALGLLILGLRLGSRVV